ncbi:MAG: farnesyl diphosphate synthase [Arenicellales bacterium]
MPNSASNISFDAASFKAQWGVYQAQANQALNAELSRLLSSVDDPLAAAMRYSTENGGKRFRAMLVYASGQCFNAASDGLDAPALALEFIHAYSLIHDDLPAMDDDDLRRGQPSCHLKFDEATAILAGDALQTLAFEILSEPNPNLSSAQQIKMVQQLAKASGASGMAGGQSLDMLATGTQTNQATLQNIHERKTGALIRVALVLGALASNDTTDQELDIISEYGHLIGLAFQVVDDILDVTQSSEMLGKQSGADAALDKNTYPALMGLTQARDYAAQLVHSAQQSLGKLKRDTAFLHQLAEFTQHREH